MIHYLRALVARLRGLFGDHSADRDLDEEIETQKIHNGNIKWTGQFS